MTKKTPNWRKIFREEFKRRQKPSIEIEFEESDGSELAPEASKFGGKPFLPTDFVWPYYRGESIGDGETLNRPLAFLLQINLADVAPFDAEKKLPERGILSFFYEVESLAGLSQPQGYARVVYFDPAETDAKTFDLPPELAEIDDGRWAELEEQALSFQKVVAVPGLEEIDAYVDADDDVDFDEVEDIYDEEREKFCGSSEIDDRSRLLGLPDVIQNPMEEECELVANGLTYRDRETLSPEREAEIDEKSKDWTLLLQLATVDDYMLGDCGSLYFWIKNDDLKRKNFDAALTEFQCY